jgi:drug/metabolite transporter (DMT)-like permease
MKKNPLRGYVLMLFGSALLTIQFGITKHIFSTYEYLQPLQLAFWGSLASVLTVLPFYLRSKESRQDLINELNHRPKLITIIGITTSISAFIWYYSLDNTSPSLVSFMSRSDLIFVFGLSVFLLGEKFDWKEILSVLVAGIGFYILSDLSSEISTALVLLILLRGFLNALQSFLIKRNINQNQKKSVFNASAFTFWRSVFFTIAMGVVGLILNKIPFIGWNILILLNIGQVIGLFIYRTMYFEAHHTLSIFELNFLALSTPVFILISGYVIGQETINIQKILGGLTILCGLGVFLYLQMRARKRTE